MAPHRVTHDGREQQTAKAFLKAIYDDDPDTFWELLGQEGRGFLKGLWYGNRSLSFDRARDASPEDKDVRSLLESVLDSLRRSLDRIYGSGWIERAGVSTRIEIDETGTRAAVKIVPEHGTGEAEVVYIKPTELEMFLAPLVAELQSLGDGGGATVDWRIDYLKVIQG